MRTKDVDTVIHQNDGDTEGLKKNLSARDLMGFGIGIVIGTGIFVLTGVEAKNHAGPAITISFVIAGIVSMLAALCYAELAAAVPQPTQSRAPGASAGHATGAAARAATSSARTASAASMTRRRSHRSA